MASSVLHTFENVVTFLVEVRHVHYVTDVALREQHRCVALGSLAIPEASHVPQQPVDHFVT